MLDLNIHGVTKVEATRAKEKSAAGVWTYAVRRILVHTEEQGKFEITLYADAVGNLEIRKGK